jgi:hypothetical protein
MAQIHGMIDLENTEHSTRCCGSHIRCYQVQSLHPDDPYDPLYFKVDVDAQTALGRHVMEDTINWWGTQPQEIQG